MMPIEQFREELFQKLFAARSIEHERLFYISKKNFSGETGDIRAYMDSEMQHFVNAYPYRVAYVSCESDESNLAFIDIVPDLKDVGGTIMQTFYFYDCDNHKISSFVNMVKSGK